MWAMVLAQHSPVADRHYWTRVWQRAQLAPNRIRIRRCCPRESTRVNHFERASISTSSYLNRPIAHDTNDATPLQFNQDVLQLLRRLIGLLRGSIRLVKLGLVLLFPILVLFDQVVQLLDLVLILFHLRLVLLNQTIVL